MAHWTVFLLKGKDQHVSSDLKQVLVANGGVGVESGANTPPLLSVELVGQVIYLNHNQ